MDGGIKLIRGSYQNVNHIIYSFFWFNTKKVHHCSKFNAHLINTKRRYFLPIVVLIASDFLGIKNMS